MTVEIELCGERLELRADRSLFWPRSRTLIVADMHFGKLDTFRAAAVPVPGGSGSTLTRLSRALDETAATRLVVLGDFWHARPGRNAAVLDELAAWRTAHAHLAIELVKGNHDRAGPPPAGWAEAWQDDFFTDPPFAYAHHPQSSDRGYVLAGHLHPGHRLNGVGHQSLVLPCFWVRDGYAVLPAFGTFTGLAVVTPTWTDRVYVIAEEEVIEIRT